MNLHRSKKSLGQIFLINKSIAAAEAEHAHKKTVLEIGPGEGILTDELCARAKKVIAVEKDSSLFEYLKTRLNYANLELINKDFLDIKDDFENFKKIDIVISNIPYQLSSTIIEWLSNVRINAVLCLQKEFVEHMLAAPGTRNYSRLSVMSSLLFRVVKIMNVKKGNFRPIPKVDSVIVYLEPKSRVVDDKERYLINLIMQHKKKTLKNAMTDSGPQLNLSKGRMRELMNGVRLKDERPFKLEPEQIIDVVKDILVLLE